ncbi:MAG: UPF0280 family protein [Burkholderiales bacterium]|nr:UPF0280 family protein [Burkholderiales bacterium]
MSAQRAPLPNGRWHFQHGPIDLVIGAEGDAAALAAGHAAAWARFETVLDELVAELRTLRLPLDRDAHRCPLQGAIACRMWRACRPYRSQFITPMAAVAGAVAQELIGAYEREGIRRAWVNNGGDIALHLAPGASVKVGLCADLARVDFAAGAPPLDADFEIHASTPVRGIATSGWRGRSFSLGIADSVTVLARSAARADAAATVIANAVDVIDARIERRPANQIRDDTDLGAIEVTVHVPPLAAEQVQRALQAGQRRARELQRSGLIHAALLVCQDRCVGVAVEAVAPPSPRPSPASGRGRQAGSLPRTRGSGRGRQASSLAPVLGGEGWGEGETPA